MTGNKELERLRNDIERRTGQRSMTRIASIDCNILSRCANGEKNGINEMLQRLEKQSRNGVKKTLKK